MLTCPPVNPTINSVELRGHTHRVLSSWLWWNRALDQIALELLSVRLHLSRLRRRTRLSRSGEVIDSLYPVAAHRWRNKHRQRHIRGHERSEYYRKHRRRRMAISVEESEAGQRHHSLHHLQRQKHSRGTLRRQDTV